MGRLRARSLVVAVLGAMGLACHGAADCQAQEPARRISDRQEGTMKIRIEIKGTSLTATLDDNPAARDFAALLPLTLTLEDYAATEKIADLPQRLSTTGTPPGTNAGPGDVSYYAPWSNLALFYKPAEYASGLVRLGRLDGGVGALRRPGPLHARIELIEP